MDKNQIFLSDKETMSVYGQMWMTNLRNNLPYIVQGKTVTSMSIRPEVKTAIIIGNGPSIRDKNPLKLLAKQNVKDTLVMASDSVYKPCLEEGVKPSTVVSIDGSPKVAPFFAAISDMGDTAAVMGAYLDNTVVSLVLALTDKIFWLAPMIDQNCKIFSADDVIKGLTKTALMPKGVFTIDCGGNVGTLSMQLAGMFPSIDNICLIGMDMGYPDGTPYEDTIYYNRFLKKMGKGREDEWFTHHENGSSMKGFTDPIFEIYRTRTCEIASQMRAKVTNCSGQGTLFSDRIKCMDFEEWLKTTS